MNDLNAIPLSASDEAEIEEFFGQLVVTAANFAEGMSYINFIVGLGRFYVSSMIMLMEQPDFPVESIPEFRDMVLGWLAQEMEKSATPAPKEEPASVHPLVGRLGYVIGSEENGLLSRHDQVFVIADVVIPPEDQAVCVVHFVDGSRGELLNDEFCLLGSDKAGPDAR